LRGSSSARRRGDLIGEHCRQGRPGNPGDLGLFESIDVCRQSTLEVEQDFVGELCHAIAERIRSQKQQILVKTREIVRVPELFFRDGFQQALQLACAGRFEPAFPFFQTLD
jgi:hypothetical protein